MTDESNYCERCGCVFLPFEIRDDSEPEIHPDPRTCINRLRSELTISRDGKDDILWENPRKESFLL